jgi:flagellum-specific peptidoglycan hydrolase FlgJ
LGSEQADDPRQQLGIKARGQAGTAGVAWYRTWEVVNGDSVRRCEPFRAYRSAADSFVDHGRFFLENRRYADALAVRGDPRQFAVEINLAGYATDPDYSDKLIALMDRFGLYVCDRVN